jgi:hypothetical protein
VFAPENGAIRLSVCRARMGKNGRWEDGITWDQLQRLKAECGYADSWAAEIFPPDAQVVNVGNLRHLWLLPEAPAFAWRNP